MAVVCSFKTIMKLLVCSIYNPESQDGVSNSTRRLVKALRQGGANVTVCTTDGGWSVHSKKVSKEEDVLVFPAHCNNRFNWSFPLARFLRDNLRYFDLAYFNSLYSFSTVAGAWYARRYGIPYCVSPCGNYVPLSIKGESGIKSPIKKRLFFRTFSLPAIEGARCVICSSESEAGGLRRHIRGGVLFEVIPNGMDPKEFAEETEKEGVWSALGIDPRARTVLFLGRMAKEKALPFLLDVWGRFASRRNDAVLVLAGHEEGGTRKRLNDQLCGMKQKDTVIFTGPVSGRIKNALLAHSDCLVLPSYFESFGIVVLEALLCGTPVIASRGTPWEELESQALGRWLEQDVEEWAIAIEEAIDGKRFSGASFKMKSREFVIKNYSCEGVTERFKEVFKQCMEVKQSGIRGFY